MSLTGNELDCVAELAFAKGEAKSARSQDMNLVVVPPVQITSKLRSGALILWPDDSIERYANHHLGAFPESANPLGRVR